MIEGAGISRRTFYELFADRADAFRAAYDEAFGCYLDRVERAAAACELWPAKVAAAVDVTLAAAAGEPGRARLVLVESLGAGRELAGHHRRSLDRLVPGLSAGRRLPVAPAEMPPTLEQGLIGGAAALIAARLYGEVSSAVPALAPELLEFLLAPYLGGAEARRFSSARMRPSAGLASPDSLSSGRR